VAPHRRGPEEMRDMDWTKSTRCGSQACVEVAVSKGGSVVVRDSKLPKTMPLIFTREEWTAFRDGVKAGDFDHI
jgi:hypothetical protein